MLSKSLTTMTNGIYDKHLSAVLTTHNPYLNRVNDVTETLWTHTQCFNPYLNALTQTPYLNAVTQTPWTHTSML